MKITHSSTVKISGMRHGLDLELDKVNLKLPSIDEEQMKNDMLSLTNRHFDPNYMEFNFSHQPDTGDISFNSLDMKFT